MRKTIFRIASFSAMTAVALGAFGAHGLKSLVEPEQLDTFQIGVRYQFYHSFALLAIAVLLHIRKTSLLVYAAWFFTAGIVLFSGSLYLLAIRFWAGFEGAWLGPITPVGGLMFIIGWILLFSSTFQDNTLRNGNGNGHAVKH